MEESWLDFDFLHLLLSYYFFTFRYQNELPKKIKSRGKDPHLTHEELVQTIKWKLAVSTHLMPFTLPFGYINEMCSQRLNLDSSPNSGASSARTL